MTRLDVNNVTQAISRYGTIPKGVRIGAYLASMETDSAKTKDRSPTDDHDSGTDTASVSSCPVVMSYESTSVEPSPPLPSVGDDSEPGYSPCVVLRPSVRSVG